MDMPKHEPPGTMRRLAATGLAASLLLAAACEASTGVQASQSVRVTAVVKRHAAIRLDAPQSLTLSEQDVARGYVDVPSPMEVTVSSNVPQGYVLAVQNRSAQVRAAVLHGLAAPLIIGDSGGSVMRRAPRHGLWSETLSLRIRFELSPQARAGVHAWPLFISMMTE
jgi:hypothetical protein